jgi:hypothetical protein
MVTQDNHLFLLSCMSSERAPDRSKTRAHVACSKHEALICCATASYEALRPVDDYIESI